MNTMEIVARVGFIVLFLGIAGMQVGMMRCVRIYCVKLSQKESLVLGRSTFLRILFFREVSFAEASPDIRTQYQFWVRFMCWGRSLLICGFVIVVAAGYVLSCSVTG